jgi:hypothetical protein
VTNGNTFRLVYMMTDGSWGELLPVEQPGSMEGAVRQIHFEIPLILTRVREEYPGKILNSLRIGEIGPDGKIVGVSREIAVIRDE